MANLVPVSSFDDVYQIETTDVVLGGAGEVANSQAQALANRTKYLKDILDAETLRSQKVFYYDLGNIILNETKPRIRLFRFRPTQADSSPGVGGFNIHNNLRFVMNLNYYYICNKAFTFEFNINEFDTENPTEGVVGRLKLESVVGYDDTYSGTYGVYYPKFYIQVMRVEDPSPLDEEYFYDFYFETEEYTYLAHNLTLYFVDTFSNVLNNPFDYSVEESITVFEDDEPLIPMKQSFFGNYTCSIHYERSKDNNDLFQQIVSLPLATNKKAIEWNNDYIIGGNSQKILYSGPKTVSLTTTNTAVKLFSYKYKLTATPLSDQRLDKSVKFDVHYGCTSDVFVSVLRQYELVFASENFYLKLLKQSSDFGNSPSVADNSPADIYLIVRQRDGVDGYTYFDFYLDDTKITETRTKNIELVVYDDVKESLRDKILFETTLSAVAKMYNVSSLTNIQTSIHSVFNTDVNVLTNIIVSGASQTAHTPSSDLPLSDISETRIKAAETDIDNLQNLVFSQWEYVVPGDYAWTCPQGVTKIKLFVVGGGGSGCYNNGGSGGGVAIHNNYTVSPGTSYNLRVGRGATNLVNADGSWFNNTSSIRAEGGEKSSSSSTRAIGGSAIGGELNLDGGVGGLYHAYDSIEDISGATGGGSASDENSHYSGGAGSYGGGGGGCHTMSPDKPGGRGGRGGIYGGNGGDGGSGANVGGGPSAGHNSIFGGLGGNAQNGGGGSPGGGGGADGNGLQYGGGGGNGCVIIRVGGSNF
jgi:hypothetical protein